MKYWVMGSAFVALCAWMFLAAGRPGDGDGLYSVWTPAQYNDGLRTVRDLTEGPLLAYGDGKTLSVEQTRALEEGREVARRLAAYDPREFGPAFLLANIEQALGNAEEAARNYHQALLQIPKSTADPNLQQTEAHIRYNLGQHYFNRNEFDKAERYADSALTIFHESAQYHTGAARIKIRLGKKADARQLVEHALEIDPNDAFAKELAERLEAN